ncbi:hypothetical protein [Paraclostridium sordellii]|uniref:hypothetical protein n=1 Tax=Paraclostridium sordellii TaxID=1505 RepID=UPI000A72F9E5|nr:hypothetical protein [Paeniclostridium sordellii]
MVQDTLETKYISKLPYPKSYEEQVLEIAPKDNCGDDEYNNFLAKDFTKICFMLDKDFINSKIN